MNKTARVVFGKLEGSASSTVYRAPMFAQSCATPVMTRRWCSRMLAAQPPQSWRSRRRPWPCQPGPFAAATPPDRDVPSFDSCGHLHCTQAVMPRKELPDPTQHVGSDRLPRRVGKHATGQLQGSSHCRTGPLRPDLVQLAFGSRARTLKLGAGSVAERIQGQAVKRPRRCIATTRGDLTSIQVRKSRVLNSRSMAGGPQIAAPMAR